MAGATVALRSPAVELPRRGSCDCVRRSSSWPLRARRRRGYGAQRRAVPRGADVALRGARERGRDRALHARHHRGQPAVHVPREAGLPLAHDPAERRHGGLLRVLRLGRAPAAARGGREPDGVDGVDRRRRGERAGRRRPVQRDAAVGVRARRPARGSSGRRAADGAGGKFARPGARASGARCLPFAAPGGPKWQPGGDDGARCRAPPPRRRSRSSGVEVRRSARLPLSGPRPLVTRYGPAEAHQQAASGALPTQRSVSRIGPCRARCPRPGGPNGTTRRRRPPFSRPWSDAQPPPRSSTPAGWSRGRWPRTTGRPPPCCTSTCRPPPQPDVRPTRGSSTGAHRAVSARGPPRRPATPHRPPQPGRPRRRSRRGTER